MRRIVLIASLVSLLGAFAMRATSETQTGNPLTTLVKDGGSSAALHGRVVQRLPAGGYTYLALRGSDGSLIWTVTLGRGAALGEQISVRSLGRKSDFYSRRLRRTFRSLVFGLVSRES